ncbi:MAG: DUF6807 family protein [Verrucomicrobiota bacterium]|nr:DUF6807 family protein [Verrucomicrobiota bacterium]
MKTSKLIAFLTLLSLLLNFSAATIEAKNTLSIKKNNDNLEVFLNGVSEPLIIQNAKDGFRPYLHPIKGPNGNGVFTQYSPGHHKHQTGLYWGLTRVNGRDYFHNPSSKYWRKKSLNIINNSGDVVVWETIYEMLNNEGEALMTETQSWSMCVSKRGEIILDLVWKGYANEKITVSKYNYGGLFLRMPWKRNIKAETINSEGDKNQTGEGKSANWIDLGMEISGLDELGRIVIYDHPSNDGFPNQWRIDGQFGIGPASARRGDWEIKKGDHKIFKHRLIVYSGKHDKPLVNQQWKEWIKR